MAPWATQARDRKDYAAIAKTEPQGLWSRRLGAPVLIILPALLLAVAAIAVWPPNLGGSTGSHTGLRHYSGDASLGFKVEVADYQQSSSCSAVDKDHDFEVNPEEEANAWGTNLDHIPSWDMCCAMCQGVPQCKSWVWVKDALPDGCHGQCWLKGTKPAKKKFKEGVWSGEPPSRGQLPASTLTLGTSSKEATGDLFCFSLMLPFGYERKLIKFQHKVKTSIFACDAWAIYSNTTIKLKEGVETIPVNTSLEVKFGGDSYTALNSWIFIAIWKKVIDEGWQDRFKWLVKVDPDAVFFPDRLRTVLKSHPDAGYVNNCRYGLHGPIEVLSAAAVQTLAEDYSNSFDGKAPVKCVEGLDFGLWGEDFFLSQCLWKIHGVSRELDEKLLCEAHCSCPDWFWCVNGTDRVSFHPFKRVDMYSQCMTNALGKATGTTPAGASEPETYSGETEQSSTVRVREQVAAPQVAAPAAATADDAAPSAGKSCAVYGCGGYKPEHDCQCNVECHGHQNCCYDVGDVCGMK